MHVRRRGCIYNQLPEHREIQPRLAKATGSWVKVVLFALLLGDVRQLCEASRGSWSLSVRNVFVGHKVFVYNNLWSTYVSQKCHRKSCKNISLQQCRLKEKCTEIVDKFRMKGSLLEKTKYKSFYNICVREIATQYINLKKNEYLHYHRSTGFRKNNKSQIMAP